MSTAVQPSASYSITMRVHIPQRPGSFGRVASAIGETGAILGAIDLVRVEGGTVVRDVTVSCADSAHGEAVVEAVRGVEGVEVASVSDRTFLMHRRGKIEIRGRIAVQSRDDLSMAYTPGVARVCAAIHEDENKAWPLTIKGNTVAVVTDGTAVLGMGDIGPTAAMPVMEGKALLFKEFAGVDAFPLCLDTKDADEIVRIVEALAPTFGGINLEDIAAPRCFEIERRLKESLDIPVFHDDQHGTAIVVLAALLNALKVVGKRAADARVVIVGAGAAGVACAKIVLAEGVGELIVCDKDGALSADTPGLNDSHAELAAQTNPRKLHGSADEVLAGADVMIGVSRPGAVSAEAVRSMAPGPDRHGHGQPGARGPARGDLRGGGHHGDRTLGLPEPDQQRARLPGRLPRRPERPRAHDRRADEAGRRPGPRRRHPRGGAARRVHHPERLQPRGGACHRRGRRRGCTRERRLRRGSAGARAGARRGRLTQTHVEQRSSRRVGAPGLWADP